MKIRQIIFWIIGVLIIFVGLIVYSILYGNPLAKHKFKSEVEIYLKETYEEKIIIDSIEYSFKESSSLGDQHFIAVVYYQNDKNRKLRTDKGYKEEFKVFEVPTTK